MYKPNDKVWVKLKGFSWWPAQIVDPQSSNISREVKKAQKKHDTLVLFFGTYDYAWVNCKDVSSIIPFEEGSKYEKISAKKQFVVAVKQAKGLQAMPSLTQKRKNEARDSGSEPEQSDSEEDTKPPRKRAKAVSKSTSTSTSTSKKDEATSSNKKTPTKENTAGKSTASDEDKEAKDTSTKKNTNTTNPSKDKSEKGVKKPTLSSEDKKIEKGSRSKSTDVEDVQNKKASDSAKSTPNGKSGTSASTNKADAKNSKLAASNKNIKSQEKEDIHPVITHDELVQYQAELNSAFNTKEWKKARTSLRKLQNFTLTFELLQDTKIGKTVNQFKRVLEEHLASISREIIEEWKNIVKPVLAHKKSVPSQGAIDSKYQQQPVAKFLE